MHSRNAYQSLKIPKCKNFGYQIGGKRQMHRVLAKKGGALESGHGDSYSFQKIQKKITEYRDRERPRGEAALSARARRESSGVLGFSVGSVRCV